MYYYCSSFYYFISTTNTVKKKNLSMLERVTIASRGPGMESFVLLFCMITGFFFFLLLRAIYFDLQVVLFSADRAPFESQNTFDFDLGTWLSDKCSHVGQD